ncbi:MAG: metallophosphatase [Cyclobacteriaceae bacterium]|nr:MAG: metallophosphatase [Cyclobacteriaceae bacterium]
MIDQRRKFIKRTIAGSIGLNLLGITTFGDIKQSSDLTILHTNDMHSRIDPFPDDGGKYAGLGGMSRRAQLITEIRSQVDQVLLLDAGDIFQGTPYFNLFGGALEFKLMSQIKYDAATLGNHDFDNGIGGLQEQLPHAKFPFIISNYDFSRTSLSGQFDPYRVFQKGSIRVGVFGLGIELTGLVAEQLYGKTRYIDPVSVAKEMVQQLKSLDCQLIVCISHLGYQYQSEKISDRKLAEDVSGIDLIIGGHTHTFLPEPQKITHLDGHSTLINQVGFGGIHLGRIDYQLTVGSANLTQSSKTVKVNN